MGQLLLQCLVYSLVFNAFDIIIAKELFLVCNINSGIQRKWHENLKWHVSIQEGDAHCLCQDHTHIGGPMMNCEESREETLAIYRYYIRYGGVQSFVQTSWIEDTMLRIKCPSWDPLGHCNACKKPWFELRDVIMSGVNIRREFTTSVQVDRNLGKEPVWFQDAYEFKPKLNRAHMSTIIYANISFKDQNELDFEIRNQNTVVWKSFRLDEASLKWSACVENEKHVNCRNELFNIPTDLFTMSLRVSSRSLITNNIDAWPDLQFDAAVENSWKSRTGKLVKLSNGQWGFRGRGCVPPYFKFKVEWYRSSMSSVGDSRRRHLLYADNTETPNSNLYEDPSKVAQRKLLQSSRECYARKIILLDVLDPEPSTMECQMPFSINTIRRMVQISRVNTEKTLRANVWSQSRDGIKKIFYSETVAKDLIKCAAPPEESAVSIGGRWVGFSLFSSGICVACSSGIMQNANLETRTCTESESSRQCCYTCRAQYMIMPGTETSEVPRCVPVCKPGQEFSSLARACVSCPAGKFSEGVLSSCLPCIQLGFPNAKATSKGCVSCGSRAYSIGSSCVQCTSGMFVAPNSSVCKGCLDPQKGYFLPSRGEVTACVLCPSGTYRKSMQTNGASDECTLCPPNMYSGSNGSLTCISCPRGTRSLPNRTMCVDCLPIDNSAFPNIVYGKEGCQYECDTAVSYAVGNIYSSSVTQGCLNCTLRGISHGMYMDLNDCSILRRCLNGPTGTVVYTGPAVFRSTQCPWKCLPGYVQSESQCLPCTSSNGFSITKHEYIDGCQYTCKDIVFRDPNLDCNETCVDLLSSEHSQNLFPRVRDYGERRSPNYQLGVCGSNERVSLSEVAFLRLGRWAHISPNHEHVCGNSLLNEGEECDDGNNHDQDGCDSGCRIEKDRYWDCDVIGQACLADCGWSKSISSALSDDWGLSLYGFVLPECKSGVCDCSPEINYYDVVRMPLGQRRAHMIKTLVSCDCFGNTMRQIEYENCTHQNQGCRLCEEGKYHDDLMKMCVSCGTKCVPGFLPDAAMATCKPDITSTQSMLETDPIKAQAMIGCTTCNNYGDSSIRFLPNDPDFCSYECYKDTTESLDQTLDYYCNQNIDNRTGRCEGTCVKCSIRLQSIIGQSREQVGKYIKGCMADNGGYAWTPCDPTSKPSKYSEFIAPGENIVVGDERSCPWRCVDGAYHDIVRGECVPCFNPEDYLQQYPCIPGEKVSTCGLNSNLHVCARCSGLTPFPMQIWTSQPPWFDQCIPECEKGVAWNPSDNGDGECIPCSQGQCGLGERYIPCSERNDTQCVACEIALSSNMEFGTEGSCTTRCTSGHFYSMTDGICVECLSVQCETGERLSTNCAQPSERLSHPECVPCDLSIIREGERWKPSSSTCETICTFGKVLDPSNQTCVDYNAALCDVGYMGMSVLDYEVGGAAVMRLNCDKCTEFTEGENEKWKYNERGSCSYECLKGYEKNGIGYCVETPTIIIQEPSEVNVIVNPYYNKTFPSRRVPHSGM